MSTPSLLDTLRDRLRDSTGVGRAVVTGTVAVGAMVAGRLAQQAQRQRQPLPASLRPAIEAETGEMEMMEGHCRYYVRPGRGTPLVLLHSINAAGSSFELKPIFEHYAATTDRPIYAMDWLGFGRSDRPAIRYHSGLYQRQLRRFLSEVVRTPSDIVACSLACEYAAAVSVAHPVVVSRLVLISPSGMSEEGSLLQRVLVGLTGGTGAFDVFFARLTRPSRLRAFYAERVFLPNAAVPEKLVEYAAETTRIRGAVHAPKRFVEGLLFMDEYARRSYEHLSCPTLIVLPQLSDELVQHFDLLPKIVESNREHLEVAKVEAGLLPQWEAPETLFAITDPFLSPAETRELRNPQVRRVRTTAEKTKK